MNTYQDRVKSILILLILLAVSVASAVTIMSVSAAVIVVNTFADENVDNDDCSLREAIIAANNDVSHNGCDAGIGDDTIILPQGTYTLTSGSKLPFINSNITIIGVEAESTIIEASDCNPVDEDTCTHHHRVFDVFSAGYLTLEEVTVRHGFGSVEGDGNIDGGGIRNQGNLTITKSIISDNKATYGGGIWNYGNGIVTLTDSTLTNNKTTNSGAGIWSNGEITLTGIILSGNQAATAGGGIFNSTGGTVSVSGGTFSGNIADNGGGILNYGSLSIGYNTTFSGNTAQTSGGGIFTSGTGTVTLTDSTLMTNTAASYGGGLYSSGGVVTIVNSEITGNFAMNAGGIANYVEMSLTGCTLTNNSATFSGGAIINGGELTITVGTISENSAGFGGGIDNYGILSISNSSFSKNDVTDIGGAIYSYGAGRLSLTMVDVLDNSANYGGGIYHNASQPLTMTDSFLSGNYANIQGGGLNCGSGSSVTNTITNSTFFKNTAWNYGGGIYNYGNLDITNSILDSNTALYNFGGGLYTYGVDVTTRVEKSTLIKNAAYNGGGIMNYTNLEILDSSLIENTALGTTGYGGGINNQESLHISNSTLSGNQAAYGGGGILNSINGDMQMINCTLTGNSANNGGGLHNAGDLDFANSIIANSGGISDCWDDGGTITTNSHNLIMDGTCLPYVSGDPLLSPLANNGGPTLTHALMRDSPATDAADPAYCPLTDQRGVERPQGDGCDIGAFELKAGSQIFLPLILR
jgi:CSLREA domain-containing protein